MEEVYLRNVKAMTIGLVKVVQHSKSSSDFSLVFVFPLCVGGVATRR